MKHYAGEDSDFVQSEGILISESETNKSIDIIPQSISNIVNR